MEIQIFKDGELSTQIPMSDPDRINNIMEDLQPKLSKLIDNIKIMDFLQILE